MFGKISGGTTRFIETEDKWEYRTDFDVYGNKLYGCDVCWTCKYFKFESMDCRAQLNPKTFIKSNLDRVKKPEWYRCVYWNE